MLEPGCRTTAGKRLFRRDAAWLFVATWFLAFLLVPCLHMVGHRDDHVHVPGGGMVFLGQVLTFHEHTHADGTRHTHAAPSQDQDQRERSACGVARHGLGSASHLALVLLSCSVMVVEQRPAPLPEAVATVRRCERPGDPVLTPWHARAPPALAI